MLEIVRLFAGLDDHELEAIESLAVRKRYRRNTILMEHGDQANTLFLIVSSIEDIDAPSCPQAYHCWWPSHGVEPIRANGRRL